MVGTLLVAQWLRIHLPMQGTWVRALRFEPWSGKISHAAQQLSPRATTTEARMPQLLKPVHLEPVLRNKRSHRSEKLVHRNQE